VEPEYRFGFADAQEAVEEWRQAAAFARCLAEGMSEGVVGRATMQALWDLRDRTEEALRRAKERAASQKAVAEA
jgi:hypothetical protein